MEKLLLTGGTGFLGKNVKPFLDEQYKVYTCGITPDDMIKANLAKEIPVLDDYYDVVLHACGKAHVIPKTSEEEKAFYDVNYDGTVHLCKALERVGIPKAFIFVSTIAVYGCEDGGFMIEETHPLNGTSPYAKSKIMAEEYLVEWCKKHDVMLSIIRPSLLAGKNAPGNLGAMVKGIEKGYYVNIGGGKVQKSIMMAEDIAVLVPLLVKKGGIYNVCDDGQPTFGQLSESVARQLGKRKPLSIPLWLAKCLAFVGDCIGKSSPFNSYKLQKMTKSLTVSNKKIKEELGWKPMDVLENYKIR